MKLSALLDANYRIQVKKCVENMFLTSPHERKKKGYGLCGGGGEGGGGQNGRRRKCVVRSHVIML